MATTVTVDNIPDAPLNSKRDRVWRRYKRLEDDRSSWRTHWMELSDYILPRRGRFLLDTYQSNRGRKRTTKIVDGTGTYALRILNAGLMSGITNPASPWFKYGVEDDELNEYRPVMEWFDRLAWVARLVLNGSTFYNSCSTVYDELGLFGTGPLYREKNFDKLVYYRPLTAGEYVIAENEFGQIDTVGRYFTMTVSQVVEKFVVDKMTQRMDWRGVSAATKKLWSAGEYDQLVPIVHMVQPRRKPDRRAFGPLSMPFRSCYMEEGANDDEFAFEGGHEKFPVYVPRWWVLHGDVYGRSPGMDTLGDVKQLQHEQKRKAQAIDKMVNPPLTAPTSMRGKPSSVLPGGVTYVDPQQGTQGFAPTYLVQPRLQEMMLDIQDVQERIKTGFFADLFAMMIESNRRQITATEVVERHEEKLVLLGPMLNRMNTEFLDPLHDDLITWIQDAGMMPPAPPEIEDMQVRPRYTSLLAQAQEAASASSIERTLGFAGNMAGLFGEDVSDIVDPDRTLREYRRVVGAPTDMLRDESDVAERRQARQQAMAQAAQAEQLGNMAQGAKVLSETDSRSPNALTDLLGGRDA